MDLRPDQDPENARNSLRTPGASTAALSSAPFRPSGDPPGQLWLRRHLARIIHEGPESALRTV